MLTDRDEKVIVAVGKSKALTGQQIEGLFFKSYATRQRRLRKELIPNKYLSNPFYWTTGKYTKSALYRLGKQGKKLYKELTGREYRQPSWSERYIPHLLQTNEVLVKLDDIINDYWLEYTPSRESKNQLDSLIELKNGQKIALELDRATEDKKDIQRQFVNYQRELYIYGLPKQIIFVTPRAKDLHKWCLEVADTSLSIKPYFVSINKVNQLKARLGRS